LIDTVHRRFGEWCTTINDYGDEVIVVEGFLVEWMASGLSDEVTQLQPRGTQDFLAWMHDPMHASLFLFGVE
jgi:hypothetical protein